jgi:ATP-dependent DNA helicase RecG
MDIEKLKRLVSKGESETLEFKKSIGLLKAIFQTVTAFLNHKGGTVLVGILDNGKIIGQEVTESTRQKIVRELAKIEPPAQVNIKYTPVDRNKQVITINVTAGKHAPYTYDGRAYHRDIDATNRMPQHLYEQKLVARGQLNHSWESFLSNQYGINDLDQEVIYETVADGVRERRIPASAMKDSIEDILLRFQLTQGAQIKNAALVLFAKDHVYLPQCQMKMARFQGKDKLGDFIDNQQVSGNAFNLLSAADDFLRRHLPISSTFKTDQLKRVDQSALPVMAVREALVNALCHRDYADQQTDFSLAIFDDRLEIWNSGLLPKKLTLKSLKESHESILRNKLIANVFYVRDYIERWGTGTNKMIKLCQEASLPEPDFSERTGGLLVTFWFKAPISSYLATSSKEVIAAPHLSQRQQSILRIIKQHGAASTQTLLSELENPPSQRTVQKDLRYLKETGLVDSKGVAKKTVWIVKRNN